MVPVKSGESKEKEPVKLKVLHPWQTVESTGSEGTILGTGLGLGLRSALKLPSFKVPPIVNTYVLINHTPVHRKNKTKKTAFVFLEGFGTSEPHCLD